METKEGTAKDIPSQEKESEKAPLVFKQRLSLSQKETFEGKPLEVIDPTKRANSIAQKPCLRPLLSPATGMKSWQIPTEGSRNSRPIPRFKSCDLGSTVSPALQIADLALPPKRPEFKKQVVITASSESIHS